MKRKSPLQAVYDRPGFLLKRCHQLAAGIFVERCGEFNLTPSQYGALCALRAYPGIDQIALGRLIGLDRSTVGLVIRLLGARDLIDREVNADDKRRMRLRLSPAGAKLLVAAEPFAQRVQQDVLAGLPKARRAAFLSLLREFLERHGATIVPEDVLGNGARADEAPHRRASRPAAKAAGSVATPRRRAAAARRGAAKH